MTDFIFLASEITADGDCSYEIKTVAPWKKSYEQPRQHTKKQRLYFVNKGLSSQSCDFSSSHVWMSDLDHKEGSALKNGCFQIVLLIVLSRFLIVLWASRRSNHSILNEINPEYSLDCPIFIGQMLKLQYFGHLMWRVTHWKRPWCWERLRAGEEGYDKGWEGWMASLT